MYDSSSTTDNVVSQPELALSNDHLRDEIDTNSIYAVPADSSQATQQLVDAGQVPALEIVSSNSSESFDAMISTAGPVVFNRPTDGRETYYFARVDGMDSQDFNGGPVQDGAITKAGIEKYIDRASLTAAEGNSDPNRDRYLDSLKQILENWDSPEMEQYKETEDSMTRESFAIGLESMPAPQDAAVTPVEATSAEAIDTSGVPAEFVPTVLDSDASTTAPADVPADVAADVSQDAVLEEPAEVVAGPIDVPAESTSDEPSTGPVDVPADVPVDPAATLSLSDDAAQLSLVQLGEGPYQVAERLLSAGESPTNHTEIMALVRAMQAQYREEYPEDPNLASLKVNHQFLTPEKVDALLSSIADPALKDSIAAKILTPAETETIDPSSADTSSDSATGETDSGSQEPGSVSDQLRATIEREAFNNMIASDGLNVFATPVDSADYLSEVDGADSLDGTTDGAITKSEIDSFISASVASNDMSTTSGDPARDAFVESIRKISENWDNPEMLPYKDAQGAITRESFAAGMESLPQRQEQVAAEKDALALPAYEGADQPYSEDATDVVSEHIEANQPEAIQPEAEVPLQSLSQEIADLAQVQKGEGPYQIAARILASGGTAAGNSEVTALMRALQAQYRLDNPDDATLAGLRQGYPLLTVDNVDTVLANITDPQMRQRIEARLFPQDSES
jgi:hypothetical protein